MLLGCTWCFITPLKSQHQAMANSFPDRPWLLGTPSSVGWSSKHPSSRWRKAWWKSVPHLGHLLHRCTRYGSVQKNHWKKDHDFCGRSSCQVIFFWLNIGWFHPKQKSFMFLKPFHFANLKWLPSCDDFLGHFGKMFPIKGPTRHRITFSSEVLVMSWESWLPNGGIEDGPSFR